MLGTDFPYRPFLPEGVPVVQVDVRGEHIGRRVPVADPLVGTVRDTVDALLPLLTAKTSSAHLNRMTAHYRRARTRLDKLARDRRNDSPLHPQYVAAAIDRLAAADAIFTVDVGTPCIWAARYVRMNGTRRLVGSFNHGSMANALPHAIGAQASHPRPAGHRAIRRRRHRDAARRADHPAPAAPAGEGRGVRQRRAVVRGT
jgi:pyruvate dehydrogenase (quinone)